MPGRILGKKYVRNPKKTVAAKVETVTKKVDTLVKWEAVPRNRMMQGLPQKKIVHHRYGTGFLLNCPAAGTVGFYRFNINDMFDPDYTSVGHQPFLRDTYAALYEKYRVLSTKVVAKVNNVLPTTAATVVGWIVQNDQASPPTAIEYLQEIGGRTGTCIQGKAFKCSPKIEINKALGLSKEQYADSDYVTAVGSSPAGDKPTFTLYYADQSGLSTHQIYIDLFLDYQCEWSHPTIVAQS